MTTPTKKLSVIHPLQRIAVARMRAADVWPYMSAGFYALSPRLDSSVPTAAVHASGELRINPEFFALLSPDEAGWVFAHEYLHVFFQHSDRCHRAVKAGLINNDHDLLVWRVAVDLQVNSCLRHAFTLDPKGFIASGYVSPEQYELPHDLNAEQYFALLKRKSNALFKTGGGVGAGECGPGAGGGEDGEEEEGDGKQQDSGRGSSSSGDDAAAAAGNDYKFVIDQKARMEQVRQAVAQAAKQQGNCPVGIRVHADAIVPVRKISWQRLLEAAVRTGVSEARGRGRETYQRPNRNQQGLRLFSDSRSAIYPGAVRRTPKVAVVFDTSGSMSSYYAEMASHALQIVKQVAGGHVTMLACDAAVHAVKKVSTFADIRKNLLGGGGTDFRPAFAAVADMPPAERPNVIVFITDGYGDYPTEPPKDTTMVWLCTPGGNIQCSWGTVVFAEDKVL